MAATFTLLKSTPYTASYLISHVPGADLDYTGADFTALAAGPYRTQIAKWLGALDRLNLESAAYPQVKKRIRVYRVSGQSTEEVEPATYTLAWTANGMTATLSSEGTANLVIEIRLIHSSRR
jgi:hypothetical protein